MARILVTDNASFMRSCLKYIVENAGHQVVGMAKGGNEAVRMYRELKPDLVTLDVLMEDGDGITALAEIMKENPQAKVIMVTAVGQEQTVMETGRAGAAGYMRKPFQPEAILAEIQRVLGATGDAS